ncbi:MAG: outer membrane protein transport protein [Tannerellaceae bacterium]|nr:outer membrane protein transport protein [Tannerellaceae bacterium]
MKKITCVVAAALWVSTGALMAQGEMDAYKLSQKDMNGTARFIGMGGAFGALGGDVSVMSTNPAGLGVFRSSEIVTSVSLNTMNTNSNFNGTTASGDKTRFNLDNFSYVGYFPTGNDEGIIGWNFGFGYHRAKSFDRTYRVSGRQSFSLADYAAAISFGIDESDLISVNGGYDPYFNPNISWMSVLGYEGGYFGANPGSSSNYHSAFGEWNHSGSKYKQSGDTEWLYYEPSNSTLTVTEKGGIDQYNFSFATNISNLVFLGATFAVTDMNYRMSSTYDETFGGGDYLYLDNSLSTDGTGYAFNIGAIVRPADFLRLGIAYNSPTWYKLTDYYYGQAGTSINGYYDLNGNHAPDMKDATPEYQYSEYRFRTPDRWIFSAAGIIGQNALISVDYELSNFTNTRLYDVDGYELEDNEFIKEDFRSTNTLRVGAEYKVTPQFAVRAGGSWQSSSAKTSLQDGQYEIYTAGTVPHYTVDRGVHSYSVGLGYRFTRSLYMDLAYVFREHKENTYLFSNVAFADDVKDINGDQLYVNSDPASLNTKTHRVALTLGYKF